MVDESTKTKEEMVNQLADQPADDYTEFEIGKDRVPWFLWVFFSLIITWASISWIKFFGY